MIQKVGLKVVEKSLSKIKNVNPLLKNASETCVVKQLPSQEKSIHEFKRFLVELKDSIKNFLKNLSGQKELDKTNKAQIAKDIYDEAAVKEAKKMLKDPNVPSSIKIKIKEELAYAIKTSNENSDFTCSGLSYLKQAILDAKQEFERQQKAAEKISFRGEIDDKTLNDMCKKEFKGKHDDLDFEDTIHKQISRNEYGFNVHGIENDDIYNDITMRKQRFENAEQEIENSLPKTGKHNYDQHLTQTEEHISDTTKEHIDNLNEQLFN